MSDKNPYVALPIKYEYYYGSKHVRAAILDAIDNKQPVSVELIGLRGMGKSSLLKNISSPEFLRERYKSDQSYFIFPIYIDFAIMPIDMDVIQFIYQKYLEASINFIKIIHATMKEITDESVKESFEEISEILKKEEILQKLNRMRQTPSDEGSDCIKNLLDDIQWLSFNDIRPVFMLDDFNLVIEKFDDDKINQLRHWRHYCWFIICSDQMLKHKKDDHGTGSKLFGQVNPIYLNGLNPSEVNALLSDPFKQTNSGDEKTKNGDFFSDEDKKLIEEVVGNHTYSLIVAAKILWEIKTTYHLTKPLSTEHRELFIEKTYLELRRIINANWKSLSEEEQEVLSYIHKSEKPEKLEQSTLTLDLLNQKGLIKIVGHKKPVISEILKRFIDEVFQPKAGDKTETEKRIHEYFIQNQDEELSFEDIWKKIWPGEEYDDNESKKRVQVNVSRLRLKLNPEYEEIVSIRQFGYKYIKKTDE